MSFVKFICMLFVRARRSRQKREQELEAERKLALQRSKDAARQRRRRSLRKVHHVTHVDSSSTTPLPQTSSTDNRHSSTPNMESSQEPHTTPPPPPPPLMNVLKSLQPENFLDLARPLAHIKDQVPNLTITPPVDKEKPFKLVHRPNATKRASELMNQHIRSTPRTNCSSVARVVQRFMGKEDTRELMIGYLMRETLVKELLRNYFETDSYKDDTIWIHKKVTRLAVCRAKGKWDEIIEIKSELTLTYSIREVARRTGRHHSHIQWYMKKPQPRKNCLGKKVAFEDAQRVAQFTVRMDVSTTLPFKRHAGNFYLKMTIDRAHGKYVEEVLILGHRALSLSAFRKCIPKEVKVMKKTPYKDCACIHCSNFALLIDALIASKMPDIPSSVHRNILKSMCQPKSMECKRKQFYQLPAPAAKRRLTKQYMDKHKHISSATPRGRMCKDGVMGSYLQKQSGLTHVEIQTNESNGVPHDHRHEDGAFCISDFSRDCIFRDCEDCTQDKRMTAIVEGAKDLDLEQSVVWRKWQNYTITHRDNVTEKKFGLRWQEGTLSDLLQEYVRASAFYTRHMFHFKWQVNQFEYLKYNLKYGEVVMVMDFAMNVAHAPQNEVQNHMWHRTSTMMHPIVCYFRCKYCNMLVTEEIVFLSDHKKKNASTVHFFERQAVAQLVNVDHVNIKYVWQFCDNCTGQYKCYGSCDTLSTWEDFGICRNFYGEQHGKGPADGCIGRIVKKVDAAVRACEDGLEIFDGIDFFRYCQRTMETKPYYKGDCVHYRRRFKYIPTHDIPQLKHKVKPIQGIRKMHSIRSTGTRYILQARENSCFCPYE